MANNFAEENTANSHTCSVCNAELRMQAKYLYLIDRDYDNVFRMNHHRIMICPKRLGIFGLMYWRHDRRLIDDDGADSGSLSTHVTLAL